MFDVGDVGGIGVGGTLEPGLTEGDRPSGGLGMGGESSRGPGRRGDHGAACRQYPRPHRWTQTYLLPEGSGEVADLWDPGAGPLFWPPAPSHLLGGRKWAGLVPRSWPPRPCIPRPTSSPQDISSKTPALERLERGGVTRGSDSQPCFSPRPLSGLLDERRGKKSRLEGSTAFQACPRSGGGRPLHCLPGSVPCSAWG